MLRTPYKASSVQGAAWQQQQQQKKKKNRESKAESDATRSPIEKQLCVYVFFVVAVCVCVCVFYIAVPPLFALSVEKKKKDILQLTSSPHHSTNTFPFFIVERVPLCYRVLPK